MKINNILKSMLIIFILLSISSCKSAVTENDPYSKFTDYLDEFINEISEDDAALTSYEIIIIDPLYNDFYDDNMSELVYDVKCSDGSYHYFIFDYDECIITEHAACRSPYAEFKSDPIFEKSRLMYAPLSYYAAIVDENSGSVQIIDLITGDTTEYDAAQIAELESIHQEGKNETK